MKWQKTAIVLCLLSANGWATDETVSENRPIQTDAEIQQLIQSEVAQQVQAQLSLQQQVLLQRQQQRENFLQLESLLQMASRQGKLSANTLQLATRLSDSLQDYPLKEEAHWAILKAKMQTHQATVDDITTFQAAYPSAAARHQLNQIPYELLYRQQAWDKLVEYSKQTAPSSVLNQCRYFGAAYYQLAEKQYINPEAEQAGNQESNLSPEMRELLLAFDQFWTLNDGKLQDNYWKNQSSLPTECLPLESYWRDQGFKTADKVRQRAVKLYQQQAMSALENLTQGNSGDLTHWLTQVTRLLAEPTLLAQFMRNQPVEPWNRAIILATFEKTIKALPEDKVPQLPLFQALAPPWGFSDVELNAWKIAFITRFFDQQESEFETWRDQQLLLLKNDLLIERRLRMAIWQHTDLVPWLNALSPAAQQKAEWRYWRGKVDLSQRDTLWQALSQERGFYSMLAAKQRQQVYQFRSPPVTPLTAEELKQYQSSLDRIVELRQLKRFANAKIEWLALLRQVDEKHQIALSEYANQQNWFDLAVEGTIYAKAWDFINLRLPNAYLDWFQIHLADKPISQTFAMAISRQESAWNPEARSSANALGLMQLLPTTASQTAQNQALPYGNENDLFNPFRNIMLGTAHLNELYAKYPNNRILIAAAYNAGAHRVEKWLARANGQLSMDEFIASIPFLETRNYVQNVLSYDYYYQLLQGKPLMLFSAQELRLY